MALVSDRGPSIPAIIEPYRMHVSARYLELTRQKLELARLPREPDLPAHRRWDYGTPKALLEPLLDFWLEGYDWRAQEAAFNDALPQFRTTIQTDPVQSDVEASRGLKIHFVHKPSSKTNAVPLLFCHGWPSSFTEILPLLNELTEPTEVNASEDAKTAFHVVAASIPGFGFSDASTDDEFGACATADVYDTLMKRLGYTRYFVHGDGWGFTIARMVALRHPDSCQAVHTCSPNLPPPSWWMAPLATAKYHIARLTRAQIPFLQFGYTPTDFAIEEAKASQPATDNTFTRQFMERPQTLSYSLCDSPVGLLASMLDVIHSSSNTYSWTQTDILNWTMMQWLPGPEAGLRWLRQADREAREQCWTHWSATPLGISTFRAAGEGGVLGSVPPMWASAYQKLAWVRRHDDKLARMPAWDAPDELVSALRAFAAEVGGEGSLANSEPAGAATASSTGRAAPSGGEAAGAGGAHSQAV